jgi:TusA-related sulfurtransferase
VAGALPEAEWIAILREAGFADVHVAETRWNSFSGAPKESADAIELGAECIALSARRPVADATLDAPGSSCADLTPLIRARIRELVSGQLLEVRTDDPAARAGVPAWSRLTGNPLEAVVADDAARTRFYLRKK